MTDIERYTPPPPAAMEVTERQIVLTPVHIPNVWCDGGRTCPGHPAKRRTR